ncbi:hypothetical protein Arub01_56470 [Actinomadura rubrobrunea]|uniref:Uncharacterized protein n=1 Tax=Actinomadura rubrobrunea TaxID=115335 RepID=A0A9W6Q2H7_9ACTN|nr:DUF6343 family protein [Actinomadura rubrobrunea]GLW67404.1 hypothetical protein Arub01_56470 [Actinomadura rubrobrunea]
MDDPRPPHRQPPGDEPSTARSPLRLRAVLSGVALVAGAAAAVLFALSGARGRDPGPWVAAAICAAVAVIAAIDLVAIARRART